MPPTREDFQPEPDSAREVRQFVSEALPGIGRIDDVVLAASELASNVIRHARTPFTVRVTSRKGRIRLEVWDGSSIIPAVQDLSDSKRGLLLIETLAESWGVDLVENGKVVWAEFLPD